MTGKIHDQHPFSDPENVRDAVRRFRGRLAAPVTVVTSGSGADSAGVTVSSVLVGGDGDSGAVHFVIGPESYLWDSIQRTGRFVVHVLDDSQHDLADVFAGVRPSPGGMFAGFDVTESPYGPVFTACATRAGCSLEGAENRAAYLLVTGRIDTVDLSDLRSPLQWFRGGYRALAGP